MSELRPRWWEQRSLPPRPLPRLLLPRLLLVLLLTLLSRPSDGAYFVTDSLAGPAWDGVGASFTGASARLLVDYAEPWRSQILDALFAPSGAPSTTDTFKGAAFQLLRLEIGADANTDGAGGGPAHMRSAAEAPTAARGWAWWLAREAFARNPDVKVVLVPIAWPAYLNGGNASATDPFADPAAAAAHVAAYVPLFEAQSGAPVAAVGLWASPLANVSALPGIVAYAIALRAALDAAGLARVRLLCADAAPGWDCLAAVDPANAAYNGPLAAAVGIVGNAGRPPRVIAASLPAATPVWVTSAYSAYTKAPQMSIADGALAATNEVIETIVNGSLGGSARLPSAFLLPFGATGTPYAFGPNWLFGAVIASQPANGGWYPSPVAWAVAAITQFVPADGSWRLLPAGSGTGMLDGGGYLACWWKPATAEWTCIAQKYYDRANAQAGAVTDEIASFSLGGQLAGSRFASANAWRSCFPTYALSPNVDVGVMQDLGALPISLSEFSLPLAAGCIYSIHATLAGTVSPWMGCRSFDCESTPPPPAKLGDVALSFTDADSCPALSGPGKFVVDVTGALECVVDAALGPCLQATASGRPISPLGPDTRPHALLGDLDTRDVMVSVDVAVARGQAGLVGARIKSRRNRHTADAMNNALGVWLVLRPGPGAVAWSVITTLDEESFSGAPLRAGAVATPGLDLTGQWFTARLQVRGTRAVASIVVPGGAPVLLFNIQVGTFANKEGFVGLGAGDYVAGGVSFRNLAITGSTTTCDALPAQGAPVTVEMCNDGAAGQVFELVLPPGGVPPANFSASTLPKTDAWDSDCGPKLVATDVAGRTLECATNFSSTVGVGDACFCAGFNGSEYLPLSPPSLVSPHFTTPPRPSHYPLPPPPHITTTTTTTPPHPYPHPHPRARRPRRRRGQGLL